jgi:hypothetical protein
LLIWHPNLKENQSRRQHEQPIEPLQTGGPPNPGSEVVEQNDNPWQPGARLRME